MRTLLFRLSALMVCLALLAVWLAVEARNALGGSQ